MTRRVHIGALSARTPVGLRADSAAAAVRAGISSLAEHPFFYGRNGEPICGAIDPRLDASLRGVDRLLALSQHSLIELGAKADLPAQVTSPTPLLLALPETRPGWTIQHAIELSKQLAGGVVPGLTPLNVQVCGHGHAGALHAVGVAVDQISAGAYEYCIVGGVDSYFDGLTLNWLDKCRLLRDSARSGFFPGEGAAFMLIGDHLALRSLDLPSLAIIRGCHGAMDHDRLNNEVETFGEPLTQAIHGATADLGPDERIDDVYCDINGERYRSEEWGFAILRLPEHFVDATRYVAPTDSWGDVGAASGALSCVLAARAWAQGYGRGPLALAWGSSMSGLRSAVLLERPPV